MKAYDIGQILIPLIKIVEHKLPFSEGPLNLLIQRCYAWQNNRVNFVFYSRMVSQIFLLCHTCLPIRMVLAWEGRK